MSLPFADEARRVLGPDLYGYLLGRPDGEPDANEAALERYRLVPRVLTGEAGVDTATALAGRRHGAPLVAGAFAGDRLFHPDGLLPVASACAGLGLPLVVSEETATPLAALAATHRDLWLQLRAAGPVARVLALVDEAASCGAPAVVLTVLAPVHPRPGSRPGGIDVGRLLAERGWPTIGSGGAPGIAPLPAFPAWGWEAFESVARHAEAAGLALFAKGILHPDDARRAREAGCSGLIASNVGLRQSAGWALAPDRLRPLAEAFGGPVLLDGGVRSGRDLATACALGAAAGIAARPVAAALAAGGEAAVASLLGRWIDELAALTAWLGAPSPAALGPDHLDRQETAR